MGDDGGDDDGDDGGDGGGAGENGSFEKVSNKLREANTTEEDIAEVLAERSDQKAEAGDDGGDGGDDNARYTTHLHRRHQPAAGQETRARGTKKSRPYLSTAEAKGKGGEKTSMEIVLT